MEKNSFKLPLIVEPLKANRWLLKVNDIPEYLVRNVKIESYVDNDKIYTQLSFSIMDVVGYLLDPNTLMDLREINLELLDPTGAVVNGYKMRVKFEKMEFVCDYAIDELLKHEFVFWVKDLSLFTPNEGKDYEKELVKKYVANKKGDK